MASYRSKLIEKMHLYTFHEIFTDYIEYGPNKAILSFLETASSNILGTYLDGRNASGSASLFQSRFINLVINMR